MVKNQSNLEIIDFVRKTTEAITVISLSTKAIVNNTTAIQKTLNKQNIASTKSLEDLDGKMDGLLTMFKYVIVPLVSGILALVGIKMIFKL